VNRWRIRRRGTPAKPWAVRNPDAGKVALFPTYEDARAYVLDKSREVPIRREIDHLRSLAPRRSA